MTRFGEISQFWHFWVGDLRNILNLFWHIFTTEQIVIVTNDQIRFKWSSQRYNTNNLASPMHSTMSKHFMAWLEPGSPGVGSDWSAATVPQTLPLLLSCSTVFSTKIFCFVNGTMRIVILHLLRLNLMWALTRFRWSLPNCLNIMNRNNNVNSKCRNNNINANRRSSSKTQC